MTSTAWSNGGPEAALSPNRHDSAREVVRSARRVLLAGLALRRLAWVATGVLLAAALTIALDAIVGLPLPLRRALPSLLGLGALFAAAWHGWRWSQLRRGADDESIALWFEARIPALRYALVTLVSSPVGSDATVSRGGAASAITPALHAELSRQVAAAPLKAEAVAAARRAAALPLGLAIFLSLAVASLPPGAVRRIAAPVAGDGLARPGATARAAADPLAQIVVQVTPPAYTGAPRTRVDDPATVTALAGSRVRIEGLGDAVQARLGTDGRTVQAVAAAGGWAVDVAAPTAPMAITLRAANRERVLLVDVQPDSAPRVQLTLPARDTVMRVAAGILPLEATLEDDWGLADASFELIVSTGDGELFEFRTLRVGARDFGPGTRRAPLAARISLDSLALKPGDLIHLRAVASDRNDVTGPGRGASETRTLRVARADEYDSVAVDPAPPSEPEKDALSQRMLLELTRALVARAPRLAAAEVTRESRRLAVEQTKLRQRVGRVVFERLGENEGEHAHFPGDGHAHGQETVLNPDDILAAAERAAGADPTRNLDNHGDETPVVAINRPLLEAYNHMWRAASELETAEPRAAIPWMERAIAALQRARAAERIYLRGRPAAVVVDLARVRLAGKNEGDPTARRPRPPADPARAQRLARFDAALAVVPVNAAAAADSMLLLRVALPDDERPAAQALDAAANALRQGGDVTAALVAARRALVTEPPSRRAVGGWGW